MLSGATVISGGLLPPRPRTKLKIFLRKINAGFCMRAEAEQFGGDNRLQIVAFGYKITGYLVGVGKPVFRDRKIAGLRHMQRIAPRKTKAGGFSYNKIQHPAIESKCRVLSDA